MNTENLIDSERVQLTPEEVDQRITPGDTVHTFMSAAAGVLIGADWLRSDILRAAENWAELAGPQATNDGHGVAIRHPVNGEAVFVSTKGETV